eukprot:TRINITY_DN17445_c0_g1_i20.p1 TRINITY_DN17445_c0_g1~~TRINITY_DN17445_c0_g1_i20.p1  ORF type:complete len:187 (-),score=14.32 TRINITY_DN17445_c0_g1_i20:113-646(-)
MFCIHVVTISGETFSISDLHADATGVELFESFTRCAPSSSHNIPVLCFGQCSIALDVPLSRQGVQDGDTVSLIFRTASRKEERKVCAKVWSRVALTGQEKCVWNSIKSLESLRELPDADLPASLESLTFGEAFNQSVENVRLSSWPAEPHLWLSLQPEHGKCASARWPAEPHFWAWK